MSIRDQLRSSLQKDGRPSKTGIRHSKAYHRFFEGYSEISVPNPNGKGTIIQRVYTGDYYRQDLTRSQRILIRLMYVALFLSIAYVFVSSAILPLASNSTWYVALPQAASVPFLFWIIIAFYSYLPAERDMTVHEYRSSSLALQKAALGSAIGLGIAAFATLVYALLNRSDQPLPVLLCAAKYVAGGLAALVVNRAEKKVHYLVIPSKNPLPVDAIEMK